MTTSTTPTSPKMIDLDTGRGINAPKQITETAPAYFLSAFRERKSLRGYVMKDREPFATLAEALKAADSLARALTINTAVPWMTGIRGGEIVKMTLAAPTPSTSHDHEARAMVAHQHCHDRRVPHHPDREPGDCHCGRLHRGSRTSHDFLQYIGRLLSRQARGPVIRPFLFVCCKYVLLAAQYCDITLTRQ